MGVPASAYWAKVLAIPELQTSIVIGAGVAIGAIYSLSSTRNELKDLALNNSYSAFALLEKEFKNYPGHRGGGDINWRAFNCLEEYIND